MAFDDLPIPNNGTTYNASSPLGLGTVANYTKNPILDVGYQCKDCRPYFAFTYSSTTYYTRVNPINFAVNDEIGIYSASQITKGGLTYTKMTRLSGKATVLTIDPSFTISYNNQTYTYDSSSNQDVFLNKLNPWSFYKPYEFTGLTDTEYGQTRCGDLDNNTSYWDTLIQSQSIKYGFDWNTVYCGSASNVLSVSRSTNSIWRYTRPSTIFRLTDFIGYNKNALCPGISPEWSENQTPVKISTPNFSASYEYSNGNEYEIDFLNIYSNIRTNNMYVGAIVAKGNLYDFYSSGRVNTLFPQNPVESTYEATVTGTLTHGQGDYDIFWVLASNNSSSADSDGPFIILPYGHSRINYSLNNMAVLVEPYDANFISTYPSAELDGQFFDFDWWVNQPARSQDVTGGKIIDEQLSYYNNLKFFFSVSNQDELNARSVKITIETGLGGTNGVPVYKVEKTIQNISPNSQYNIGINVPFNSSSTINIPQKLGDNTAGDVSCGLGFKIYFQIDGAGQYRYIDMVTRSLTTTDPGYQYLYSCMLDGHWLLSTNYSYIWDSGGFLNSYAPVLDDNSIVFI